MACIGALSDPDQKSSYTEDLTDTIRHGLIYRVSIEGQKPNNQEVKK
jgi:hypothetical protein